MDTLDVVALVQLAHFRLVASIFVQSLRPVVVRGIPELVEPINRTFH